MKKKSSERAGKSMKMKTNFNLVLKKAIAIINDFMTKVFLTRDIALSIS